MDDSDGAAGDSAGFASAGAAGRRPLCDFGFERSLPPGDQPQQPVEESVEPAYSGSDHPQRKTHASGSGRRTARQRPPRPRRDRRGQPVAEKPLRHAQRQTGSVPPEPAGEARGLFRPFGDRGRAGAQAQSVRLAQEDGNDSVRTVHHPPSQEPRPRPYRARRQEDDRARRTGGLGYPRRGDQGPSGDAQPRADAAPPQHSGVRPGADRRFGAAHPSAGLYGVQRRLRRRPDGRACAAFE
ncbi:hypothetical protein SDC9_118350 [bioreactor metagenome]|uniref:Uncharacterized protein n=1 Tax=bioreactor metagenome TaxID=1076179 RepID=A0A645C1H5_9ZZZZ